MEGKEEQQRMARVLIHPLCLYFTVYCVCMYLFICLFVYLSTPFHPPLRRPAEGATCNGVRCWRDQRCLTHVSTGMPQCTWCGSLDSCRASSRPVCASDGKVYPSWCALRHEACRSGRALPPALHHHCSASEYTGVLLFSLFRSPCVCLFIRLRFMNSYKWLGMGIVFFSFFFTLFYLFILFFYSF